MIFPRRKIVKIGKRAGWVKVRGTLREVFLNFEDRTMTGCSPVYFNSCHVILNRDGCADVVVDRGGIVMPFYAFPEIDISSGLCGDVADGTVLRLKLEGDLLYVTKR